METAMVARDVIREVIDSVPHGLFLMTAAYDDTRTGVLSTRVQVCSADPCLVVISIPRGTSIEPLLRDSRSFALCRINENDRLVQRRFDPHPRRGDDPFVAMPTSTAVTGAPIVHRAVYYFDCSIVGHLAPEADCRLYLGEVRAIGILENEPEILPIHLIEAASCVDSHVAH